MKEYQIYLCGGMGKFGKDEFDKGNAWRVYCEKELRDFAKNWRTNCTVKVHNPNDYYNFLQNPPLYDNQREVMEFDLNLVRHSDLIIINFNDVYSLGSMAELAIAYERRIPVIGLNTDRQVLHPWQECMCNRIFNDIDEMLDYVEDFYLV